MKKKVVSYVEHALRANLFSMVIAAVLLAGIVGMPVISLAAGTGPQPAFLEMEDGEYAIGVDLEGGSGKAAVTSPAGLIVQDGNAFARIEWSSSHYDYMLVEGEKYLPINEEGNSTFEIPITVFDEPMEVVADTTAMSTPHEVDYTLIFHSDAIIDQDQTPQAAAQRVVYMVIIVVALCAVVSLIKKRRNSRR